jgi:hypothetical protein
MGRHLFDGHTAESPVSFRKVIAGFIYISLCRVADWLYLITKPRIFRCGFRLWARGLLSSPYSESGFTRVYSARQAKVPTEELVYGETPVFTGVQILREAGACQKSKVLDLGAGRGRFLLAARCLNAEAKGIELLNEHVVEATEPLSAIGAQLEQGIATQFEQAGATHVFVAWTCMGPVTRLRLTQSLQRLTPGTIVMVVTWPIEGDGFETLFSCKKLFTWGPSEVYAYVRRAAF